MRKLLNWLDDNILQILAGFLLVFIPLYPKLPLFDVLPGYIVRVRLEDIFVIFTFLIWTVRLIRGKINLESNPLLKPIVLYLSVGFLSMLSAVFITQTVPMESIHLSKLAFHYFRRVEYFSLFFIFFASVKNLKTLKIYAVLFLSTITLVALYGFGQKYLYWPAFSTMNREFSKGWVLYLTKHARVISTFGGHYDLAAFIMTGLVMLWSLFFGIKKWVFRGIIFLIISAAFWTLILTASRTSFLAYLGGVSFLFFFWAFIKGIRWSISRWLVVVMLSIVVMLSFGDLSERFTKLLKLDERLAGIKSLVLSPIGKPPSQKALFLANNPDEVLSQITSSSDQPPTTRKPSDVAEDLPLMIPTGTDSASLAAVPRTYSPNAFLYDLSTAIRFDALWPMAINGFKKNPLLGSGYSTLNKMQQSDFTEAESTDNDYLRSLGETGILGFVTFFGIFVFIIYYIYNNLLYIKDSLILSMSLGLLGVLFGLLINAVYIDVFEASKVAFSFWAITGLTVASVEMAKKNNEKVKLKHVIFDWGDFSRYSWDKIKTFFRSDLFPLLIIMSLAFILRLPKINSPLADWHSWRQSDTSAVTRNFVKNGVSLLYPAFDDLSNIASGLDNPRGYRFVEFPLYNYFSIVIDKIFVGYTIEVSGRLASIFSAIFSIIFIYKLTKKYLGKREAIFAGFLYAVLPYNIFYTRVILPEPFMVFNSLGMLYFADKAIERSLISKKTAKIKLLSVWNLFLALIFTLSSVLVKPYSVFLFLPLIYLWIKGYGLKLKPIICLVIFLGTSLIPFALWRAWISNFPEGIPAYTWLLNGDNIRFKGAFFYWIFADRLARLIMGYWGVSLFVLGLIAPRKKEGAFFIFWLLGILLYLIVFATGNVRHDYYQIITVPIIVIFMAKGMTFVLDISKDFFFRLKSLLVLLILVVFSLMFGWYHIRDFYNINHPEIVEAGRSVERKTPRNALVIAPYNGDTAFLYQTNRSGWPIMQDSIDKMIERGADYYVSVNFDDLTKQLIKETLIKDPELKKYKLIELTSNHVIIQLVPDKELPR